MPIVQADQINYAPLTMGDSWCQLVPFRPSKNSQPAQPSPRPVDFDTVSIAAAVAFGLTIVGCSIITAISQSPAGAWNGTNTGVNAFNAPIIITIGAAFRYDRFTMSYGVASLPFSIVVYSRPNSANTVLTVTRDVSAASSGWQWTYNDVFDLAGAGFGGDAYIDRIEITIPLGFFAIDNLIVSRVS